MRKQKPTSHRLVAMFIIILAATVPVTMATPNSWTGTGTDALWSTPGNWSTGFVPTGVDDVTVGTTYTSGSTITLSGINPINSLVFDPGTVSQKDLSGGTIQIATGNITVDASSTKKAEITSAIDLGLGGANVWAVNGSGLQFTTSNFMVNGGSGAGTTITKTGTGSLYLAGNNQSYAGNWNIAGNVYTTFSNAFGSGNVSFSNTVWYVGWTSASYTYANNITFTNNMFVGGSATGATITLTGMLTGSGNLFFNDNGGGATGSTTILAGTNNITSGVFQIDNTVQLNTSGYLAGVTSVNLTRWGTSSTGRAFNWNVAETVAASTTFNFGNLLSGQNQLGMLASGTTTINGVCNLNSSGSAGSDLQISAVSGGTLVLAGQVSDSLWAANARAVNKIGAGTAVLSANTNNYRGGTTVSVGTLLVDNASGSGTGTGSVSVSGGGATLGGTGIIAPTGTNGIAVASGGFIEPGSNGIGTLTINLGGTTGTVSMASGSGFKFELGTANVSIGTIAAGSSDRLAVSGATAGDFTFNLNNVDFSNTGSAGYYKLFSTDLNLATTWIGLTFDASTGVVSSGLTYSGLAAGLTGGSFIVGTGSGGGFNGGTIGDIYFYSTITPEPSTWVLLTFSLAALAVFRHRLQTIDKK